MQMSPLVHVYVNTKNQNKNLSNPRQTSIETTSAVSDGRLAIKDRLLLGPNPGHSRQTPTETTPANSKFLLKFKLQQLQT